MKLKLKITVIVFIMALVIFSTQVLALDGYAVCFGLNERAYSATGDGADATNIVNSARDMYASMGYTAYKYINPTFTRFQSFLPDNSTRMLESDIVLIAGHADSTYMQVNEQVWLRPGNSVNYVETNTGTVGINRIDWSDCNLVILLGCNTAGSHPNPELPNIQKLITDKGTNTIGWIGSIYVSDSEIWMQRFNNKLAENKTVEEAMRHANSYWFYQNGDTIKSSVVLGNSSIKLVRNSANSISQVNASESTDDNLITKTYNEEISFNKEDLSYIVNTIKQDFNSNFNIEDFEVNMCDNGENKYTIDFVYKIDDVYTDLGCSVFIKDNKLVEISSNIKDVNLLSYQDNVGELNGDYNNLKSTATNKIVSKCEDANISKQNVKKFYNTSENEKKVVVLTEYEKDGVTYTDSYTQNI